MTPSEINIWNEALEAVRSARQRTSFNIFLILEKLKKPVPEPGDLTEAELLDLEKENRTRYFGPGVYEHLLRLIVEVKRRRKDDLAAKLSSESPKHEHKWGDSDSCNSESGYSTYYYCKCGATKMVKIEEAKT